MSEGKVRNLWGRKFNVVREGLDENQVANFVDEIIEQRDTLLAERKSLLSYIKPYKSMEDELRGSSRQQADNKAGVTTELGQDTQPQMEAAELEEVTPPVLPEAIEAEAGNEESAFYQGEVELVILPPVDAVNLLQFERRLVDSFELKIVSTDGSQSKGSLITVLLNEPQPLLRSLKQMTEVEEATNGLDTPPQATEITPWRFRSNNGERIWITLSKG